MNVSHFVHETTLISSVSLSISSAARFVFERLFWVEVMAELPSLFMTMLSKSNCSANNTAVRVDIAVYAQSAPHSVSR